MHTHIVGVSPGGGGVSSPGAEGLAQFPLDPLDHSHLADANVEVAHRD